MWKLLSQCVTGSSHQRLGQPCQDACAVANDISRDEPILILACADGAGSARFAELGAASACETIVSQALTDLRDGLMTEGIEPDTVLYWTEEAPKRLTRQSQQCQ